MQMPSRLLTLLVAVLLVRSVVHAQNERPGDNPKVDTYAITNARIVPVSGAPIEKGTIVVRNGLIAAVGAAVAVPRDARAIDGTGLTVYPGFIDANTSLGLPAPAQRPATPPGIPGVPTTPPQAGTATALAQGLTPEATVTDQLKPSDQFDAARNAGITAALSAPREGIVTGQSAFINLAGETSQDLVVRAPVALHIVFTTSRAGGYPGSLMGTFAAIRQAFLDARRYRDIQAMYEKNPRGMRRPEYDKPLAALVPVVSGTLPVAMQADTEREIERALDLAEEFKLKAVIVGGREADKLAARLKALNVPVLLSLNFPKRPTSQSSEADPEPLSVLRTRADAPKTAGRLAAAGVTFAFQSGGLTSYPDFLANAAKAVENGLAKDAALRAMTLQAADILGVGDRLGSLDTGKIANLTIMRGDLFDKKRQLAYVFIDGRPVDLKPAVPPAQNAVGTWTVKANLGDGEQTYKLAIKRENEKLTGTFAPDKATEAGQLSDISVAPTPDASTSLVLFSTPVTVGGQTTLASFSGRISGNDMTGTATVKGKPAASFTAAKSETAPAADARPTAAAAANVDVTGTWTVMVSFGGNNLPMTMTLKQEGATVTGNLQAPFGSFDIRGGSVSGNSFKGNSTINAGGQTFDAVISGTVTGNQMSGTIASPQGTAEFTGSKPQD